MRKKKWMYKCKNLDRNAVLEFSKSTSFSPLVSTLLFNRGIFNENSAKEFFSKSVRGVHNPSELIDADAAADRIISAVSNKEKIAVYGDYDVDGITSTALMCDFLKSLGADVVYYIPDRADEGYGVNILAVNKLKKSGVKLIITVDCGITSVGEVEFAKLSGVDFVITDHHMCQDKIPRAVAVVDLKRKESTYPFDALAGVGVAFKLMLYIAMKLGFSATEYFNKYADLAAIGTVADIVSLTDENRVIVSRGVDIINQNTRVGIKALLDVCGVERVSPEDIAFSISPRLNAAGRMGKADLALKLLLSHNAAEAKEYAELLDRENMERRATEAQIFEEALSKINEDANFSAKKVIVVCGHNWHHGVIGIVASKLGEKFFKPCIVLSEHNGVCKGSARSIPGFDLFVALDAVSDTLIEFGGHSGAAGLSVSYENIDKFSNAICKYANSVLTEDDMVPCVNIDCELNTAYATLDFTKRLSAFEPFGQDNDPPVFSMCKASVLQILRIGKDMSHLKVTVQKDNKKFSCIGFGMGDYADYITAGDCVDAAFSLSVNTYNSQENLQFMLKDIRITEE